MHHPAADIARRSNQCRAYLFLDGDIPRVRIKRRKIIGTRDELTPWHKGGVLVHTVRIRIAAGDVGERIGETCRIAERCPAAPWVGTALVFTVNARDVGVAEGIGGADRQLAIPLRIPGNPSARIKMPPLPVGARLFRETRIAGKIESDRRFDKNCALDTLQKSCQIEIRDLAIGDLQRKVRLPANAKIKRQPRVDLPGVGKIQTDAILACLIGIGKPLEKRGRGDAKEKIRQAYSDGIRAAAGELEIARRREVIQLIYSALRSTHTEAHLVRAPNPTDIVVQRDAVSI